MTLLEGSPVRCVSLCFAALLASPLPAQEPATEAYQKTLLSIQAAIEQGTLDEARAQAQAAEKRYPASGGVDNLLGVIEAQRREDEAARQAFRRALQKSPRLVPAYLNLARLDLTATPAAPAQVREAFELYKKALQLDPRNAEASVEAASILAGQGQYAASLRLLAPLDTHTQASLQVASLLCADYAAAGNAPLAERTAAALRADPELSEQDVTSMLPGLRAGRRADLLDGLLEAVAQHHALSPHALRLQGLAQEAEGQPQKARHTLELAYAGDPSSVAVLTDLTRVALASGDNEGALGYLAHARALAPSDAGLSYQFGVVCFRMHLLGEAQKAMEEALAAAPGNPEYLHALSTLLLLSQNPLQAAPVLAQLRAARPHDAEALLLTGAMYFNAKDFENAQQWLAQAAEQPTTAASALLYLGSMARQQAQYNDALRLLGSSDRLRPGQAETHAELGQVYLQLKRYPEAQAQLEQAVALDATSYGGNFGLLQLYARTGDPRRAEQAKRFDALKAQHEQELQEAMRSIEVRPSGGLFAER